MNQRAIVEHSGHGTGKALGRRLGYLLAVTAAIAGGHSSAGVAAKPVEADYSWTRGAAMPEVLSELSAVALNGKIYVIAGSRTNPDGSYKAATDANRMFDPATGKWSRKAPLPWESSHVGVTTWGGKIYAVGGFRDLVHVGPQANFASYDPVSDHWTVLPPLPHARGSVAAAAVGGKIHVFGGRDSKHEVTVPMPDGTTLHVGLGTVGEHDVFDLATGRWSTAAPLPDVPRDHMGIAVLNGKIHLFGGRIADFSDLQSRHDVFDPATGKWSVAAPLPEVRSAGAFTVLGGRIVYAGGECRPGGQPGDPKTFDNVAAYDGKSNRWRVLPPMIAGGHQALTAATVGRKAFFFGGSPICGGGGSNDLVVLTVREGRTR